MSGLIDIIEQTHSNAASTLKRAGCHTNSEIQALTRVDLNDLFPGPENFKMRREIFEIIDKQPVDLLLNKMEQSIAHGAALTDSGVLADYLHIMKDFKTQVNNMQTFIDAHINLLENVSKGHVDLQPQRGSLSGTCTSATYSEIHNVPDLPCGSPQVPQGQDLRQFHPAKASLVNTGYVQRTQVIVRYNTLVSGTTFGAHVQLLDKVKPRGQDWALFCVDGKESPSDQDYPIILFCPISTRVGTDVEAAMCKVKDNKPIILVLMHHIHEPKNTTCMRTWRDDCHNVVLHVNVFYHETVKGLLNCQQNDEAASAIQRKLLEYKIMMTKVSSGHAPGVSSDRADSVSGLGGVSGFLFKFFPK